MIRAFYRSAKVEGASAPYDTITLKVYYPAIFGDTAEERNTGVIPADASKAPYPVVIFMPGVNVGMESYAWIGMELAKRGIITVLYTWIAEDFPGSITITPGMDLNFLKPDTYDESHSANALPTILSELARINESSVLADLLDLNKIYLGGHSAGGTMALLNANSDWFPQLRGAFTYGAHSGASTMLGYPPATILPLHDLPLLIMGGTEDGVIAESSHRYALEGKATPTLLLERTFDEATNGDATLIIIEDANHFLISDPDDETTGRGFLEKGATENDPKLRSLLIDLIEAFISSTSDDNVNDLIDNIVKNNPLISKFKRKE
ncbi:MAG: dienelactone hydrolase [Chloroflexi bacterium]|nr:dienelactone hydrolase [Chloroflexota bacterium]